MSAKDFVKAFYKSDALIDSTILKEFILEQVLGKRIEAPRINPAVDSITIAKISIAP